MDFLPLQRKDAPGKQPATPRMGYTRIEPEAGGAARRIGPNDIRDNRRRDGREGEYGAAEETGEGAPTTR